MILTIRIFVNRKNSSEKNSKNKTNSKDKNLCEYGPCSIPPTYEIYLSTEQEGGLTEMGCLDRYPLKMLDLTAWPLGKLK